MISQLLLTLNQNQIVQNQLLNQFFSLKESKTWHAFVEEIYPLSLALGAAIGFPNFLIIFKKISDFGILTAIVFNPETAKSRMSVLFFLEV